MQNKREKELEDMRKNWVFVNPDESTKGPTPEEIFGLKEYEENGEEKKPMSVLEKFYQKPDRKRSGADEPTDAAFGNRENEDLNSLRPTDRWDSLGGGVRKPSPTLKGLFGSDPDGQTVPRTSTLNGLPIPDWMKVGGFQNSRTTPEQARMDARMEEYKQFLGPRSTLPANSGSLETLNPKTDTTDSSLNPLKSLEPFSSPAKQDPLGPFQNAVNPVTAFQPSNLQDVNARAFGQPGPATPLSPASTPKAQPPATPFTFPTRKF